MGNQLSTAALTVFEVVNELYIAVGAGFWGIAVLVNHGIRSQKYSGTLCVTALTTACLIYVFNHDEFTTAGPRKVVVITGCDSGLGFSMALHLTDTGFRVLAGCLDVKSEGSRDLTTNGVQVFELNVTNVSSVNKAVKFVHRILEQDSENELWAVINNAGMMVFAEFEWQTDKMMFDQINVNLIGAMRVTKGFAPLMRQHKSRLINVSSHCALESLPGLGVYGASKAGLQGFSNALRVELGKYGIRVISFIPGSFPTQSNIFAKQMEYVYEMHSEFTREQEEFYGDYFQRYNAYLSAMANPNPARKLSHPDLYEQLEHSLLACSPRYQYKVEPIRYSIYHMLFKMSPLALRDYFVEMFVRMPKYEAPERAPSSIATIMARARYDADMRPEKLPKQQPWGYPNWVGAEHSGGENTDSPEMVRLYLGHDMLSSSTPDVDGYGQDSMATTYDAHDVSFDVDGYTRRNDHSNTSPSTRSKYQSRHY